MIWKFNKIKKWVMKLPKKQSRREENSKNCNDKNDDQIQQTKNRIKIKWLGMKSKK